MKRRSILKLLVVLGVFVVGFNYYLDSRQKESSATLVTAVELTGAGEREDSSLQETGSLEEEASSGEEQEIAEADGEAPSQEEPDGADEESATPPQAEPDGIGKNGTDQASGDSGCLIEDFEIIYQMPELPTGCEIVALTMVLNYYGFNVDKTVMASEYLPTADAVFYYGEDGLKYGPDLNQYFVGDPFSSAGYVCGTGAIRTAANSYLRAVGSSLTAVDLTGAAPEELYRLVSEGVPVVVWVTIGMTARYTTAGWYTEEGEYVEWSTNDHGAVLIGYTDDTVTIADPISGLVEYSREDFESVFASRGNQCVILR